MEKILKSSKEVCLEASKNKAEYRKAIGGETGKHKEKQKVIIDKLVTEEVNEYKFRLHRCIRRQSEERT